MNDIKNWTLSSDEYMGPRGPWDDLVPVDAARLFAGLRRLDWLERCRLVWLGRLATLALICFFGAVASTFAAEPLDSCEADIRLMNREIARLQEMIDAQQEEEERLASKMLDDAIDKYLERGKYQRPADARPPSPYYYAAPGSEASRMPRRLDETQRYQATNSKPKETTQPIEYQQRHTTPEGMTYFTGKTCYYRNGFLGCYHTNR